MLCHLSALSGFIVPLGSVIGPLIVWLIKKMTCRLLMFMAKKHSTFKSL
nr:DUF4870 domain-containing protein [Pseudoalteromonas sp. WY3]